MTTTAEQFTVGQVLTTREQVRALPVGAIIRSERGDEQRVANDRFTGGSLGTRHVTNIDPGTYRYEIVGLPEPHLRADLPPIGTSIRSREMLLSLPTGTQFHTTRTPVSRFRIGAEVRPGEGRVLICEPSSGHPLTSTRTDGFLIIESYPSDFTIDGTPPVQVMVPDSRVEPDDTLPEVTFTGYLQRFWTVMYGYVHAASERVSAVDRAMRALGVTRPSYPPGGWVHTYDPSLSDLPQGTVISRGDPIEDAHDHAVLGVNAEGVLQTLLGYGGRVGVYKIDSIPGVQPSSDRPTYVDRDLIQDFKVQAWMVGIRAKSDNGWCPQFERAMGEVDIDHNCLMTGDWLPAAQVAEDLPEGTILRYADHARSVLFRRDDTADNPARTRRIGGTTPGDWAESMFVVAQPGETYQVPIHSHAEMNGMPPGTRVDHVIEGHDWYAYSNEFSWRRSDTGGGISSTNLQHMFYVYTVLP